MGVVVCVIRSTPASVRDVIDPVRMGAVVLIPVVMVLFALEYTGRRDLIERKVVAGLFVVPAVSMVFLVTPLQPYFVEFVRAPISETFMSTKFAHGPWYQVHALYSMALTLFVGALFIHQAWRSSGFRRRQTALLFVGYCFPVVGMLLGAYGPKSLPRVDYATIAFGGTSIFWYFALFHYKLLEVSPVSRERVVDLMEDAVVVLDSTQRVTDANDAALALMGIAEQKDVFGLPIEDVLPDNARDIARMLDELEARAQVPIVTSHGRRVFDVRHTQVSERRAREEIGGVLVLRDVTEQVLLIEELDAHAHTVAHDLVNPLSGLKGYLEMAEEGALSAQAQTDIARAQQITDKMAQIVEELLVLASVRTDEDASLELLEMGAILEQVERRLAVPLMEATLERPEGEWPGVLGRPVWVEEVWANYISNAVKYGGERPRVRLGAAAPQDGLCRLSTSDAADERQVGAPDGRRARKHTNAQ